jgi:hypothetical protein
MDTDFKSSEEFAIPSTREQDRTKTERKKTDRKKTDRRESDGAETSEEDPREKTIVDPSEKPEDEEGQVKPIRPEERNPKKMNH